MKPLKKTLFYINYFKQRTIKYAFILIRHSFSYTKARIKICSWYVESTKRIQLLFENSLSKMLFFTFSNCRVLYKITVGVELCFWHDKKEICRNEHRIKKHICIYWIFTSIKYVFLIWKNILQKKILKCVTIICETDTAMLFHLHRYLNLKFCHTSFARFKSRCSAAKVFDTKWIG